MKTIFSLVFCVLALSILSGCGEGKWAKMTNQELVEKNDGCVRGNPSSPGKVTACENVKKECKRRRDNGNYAC
ncbi:MAG: hypothetical protein ACI93R_003525 [Flavobacteriales bacterium]|jgi:hypothetical protein